LSIPQEINYRLGAIKCAERYGVKKASVKYHTSPTNIYRWIKKLKENNHSMFEATARRLKIKLKHIKPHAPKHNGKVERSHREDQRLFYSEIIRTNRLITNEDDSKRRLKRHQDKTNNQAMRPLGYLSPKQYLEQYKKNKS